MGGWLDRGHVDVKYKTNYGKYESEKQGKLIQQNTH